MALLGFVFGLDLRTGSKTTETGNGVAVTTATGAAVRQQWRTLVRV